MRLSLPASVLCSYTSKLSTTSSTYALSFECRYPVYRHRGRLHSHFASTLGPAFSTADAPCTADNLPRSTHSLLHQLNSYLQTHLRSHLQRKPEVQKALALWLVFLPPDSHYCSPPCRRFYCSQYCSLVHSTPSTTSQNSGIIRF